jgi:hypothetical protein
LSDEALTLSDCAAQSAVEGIYRHVFAALAREANATEGV